MGVGSFRVGFCHRNLYKIQKGQEPQPWTVRKSTKETSERGVAREREGRRERGRGRVLREQERVCNSGGLGPN